MKIRVFAGGGLGNQIWQYTFTQYLKILKHLPAQFCHLQNQRGLEHTKISLLKRLQTETREKSQPSFVIGTAQTLLNPWNNYVFERVWGVKYDFREYPFIDPREIDSVWNSGSIVGYFQNKNFLDGLEDFIQEKLMSLFQDPIEKLENQGKIEVIHIRGGDTTTAENRKKVGLLSNEYYRNVLSKKSSNTRIVVTDDISRAQAVLRGFNIDAILDNTQLNVFQTLDLMSRAQKLITANSTLSWWGGFLSSQSGGEVIIPFPFFAGESLKSNESLNYCKFQTFRSDFD